MSASTEKKNRQAAREAGTDKKMLAAQEEAKKKAKSKRNWTIGTILVVILIAGILFLDSGFLYKHTPAVTVGDESYSPAEVNYQYAGQFFYWVNQYGSYASIFGLDTSLGVAGLDSQSCPMIENGTWKDFFLESTINQLVQNKALLDYAAENGIELSEEDKTTIDSDFESLTSYAKLQGYSSVDNFLAANYGNGVNSKIALDATYKSTLANETMTAYSDSLTYSADELEEHDKSYNGDRDYFDVAYYYVTAEKVTGEDGTDAVTEETVAAAKDTADAILAAYEEQTGDDVVENLNAALAEAGIDGDCVHSSNTQGSNLGAYKEWAVGSRKAGDATVTENSTADGYYVVAFISRNDNHYKLAQVRHILVKAEADANGEYTDEAKAAAKAKAEEIYNEWKSGAATEDSFAELAEKYSEDTGSNTNGGLYDSVRKGQMVEEFDKFCFEGHKPGDTAIVYGESAGSYAGYHVMYYVGEGQQCSDSIAESDLKSVDLQEWLDGLTANYEAERGFWLRLIG